MFLCEAFWLIIWLAIPQWTEEGSATCQHEEVVEEVRSALEEVLGAQKDVEEHTRMILNAESLEEAKQLYLIYQVYYQGRRVGIDKIDTV